MMKNKMFLLLSLGVIFSSCKKTESDIFSFDQVEYYHSKIYKLPKPPSPDVDNFIDYEFYHSDFIDKKDILNHIEFTKLGFLKEEINEVFSLKINDFFTNKNPGSYYPDYKCLNCYQDILLFYNKKKIIGVAKFDFICNKYCFTSFLSNKSIYLKRDLNQYKYLFKH